MKKHFIADKLPILSAVLLMVLTGDLIDIALGMVFSFMPIDLGEAYIYVFFVVRILVTFLILWLYKLWFKPEYEGSVKPEGIGYGLKLSLPFIIAWGVWMVIQGVIGASEYGSPEISGIIIAIIAGVTEEQTYRGIGCAMILRKYRSEKSIWVAPVVTGVFFGLAHITNLNVNEDVAGVIGQNIFAILIGIVFGVVFTMTGSVLPTMIVHSVYDIAQSLNIGNANGFDVWKYVDLGMAAILAAVMMVILYKKRTETAALWARKWNNS